MNGPEQSGDGVNRPPGDAKIGKELTEFFIGLLKDGDALKRYYDRDTRESLIDERAWDTEAGDLIRDGKLKDIERHILAQGGSYAKPLMIVWPAM
jgi:hypothetical protein